jgi:surface protein
MSAVISSNIQLFYYRGSNSIAISSLPSISNIVQITKYVNGSPVNWTSGLPSFLQGFSSLDPNTGYLVISSESATFPFNLHNEAETTLTSKTITQSLEISEFSGTTIEINNASFFNKVNKIFTYVNSSPLDWTKGVPNFLQGFNSLENGKVYLFNSVITPYTLFTDITTTTTTTTTTIEPGDNILYGLSNVNNDYLALTGTSSSRYNNRSFFVISGKDPFVGYDYIITDIAIGFGHLLFLTDDGALYSVGTIDGGALGDGSSASDNREPVRIGGNNTFTSIAAGSTYSFAVASNGTLWAAGSTSSTSNYGLTLAQVGIDNNWLAVYNGAYAIKTNGTLWSFGATRLQYLKNFSTGQIGTDTDWKAVFSNGGGAGSSEFFHKGDILYAIGENSYGELGLGNSTDQIILQAIPGFNSPGSEYKVSSTGETTLILKKDNGQSYGTLYGCGRNNYRQVLDGSDSAAFLLRTIDTNVIDMVVGYDGRSVFYIKNGNIYYNGYILNSTTASSLYYGSTLATGADRTNGYVHKKQITINADNFTKIYGSTIYGQFYAIRPEQGDFNNPTLYYVDNKTDLKTYGTAKWVTDNTDLNSYISSVVIDHQKKRGFFANSANDSIIVMDLVTGRNIATIYTGYNSRPVHLEINQNLGKVYCCNKDSDKLMIIDTSTYSTNFVSTESDPNQSCIGTNNQIYVAHTNSTLIRIYSSSGSPLGSIDKGINSYNITYSNADNSLYTTKNSSTFYKYTLDANGVTVLSTSEVAKTSTDYVFSTIYPIYYIGGNILHYRNVYSSKIYTGSAYSRLMSQFVEAYDYINGGGTPLSTSSYIAFGHTSYIYIPNYTTTTTTLPPQPTTTTTTTTTTSTTTTSTTTTGTTTSTTTTTPSPEDFIATIQSYLNSDKDVNIQFNSAPTSIIDWGDDSAPVFAIATGIYRHTYPNSGEYTLKISSLTDMIGITLGFTLFSDQNKIIKTIDQFGTRFKPSTMAGMFKHCSSLKSVPSTFTPSGTSLNETFFNTSLNCDLSNWNVSNIIDFSRCFASATSFNGNISTWNVSNGANFAGMFDAAFQFNQDISNWNVANATNFEQMFRVARAFNQDISSWNVSSVINFTSMFNQALAFNQDIGSWDVSGGRTFSNMFNGATSFDQNLSSWDISSINTSIGLNSFMQNITLSTANYDAILRNWSINRNSYRADFFPHFGNSQHSASGIFDKLQLIAYGWTITDANGTAT